MAARASLGEQSGTLFDRFGMLLFGPGIHACFFSESGIYKDSKRQNCE
jgi:hypothetical protein